MSKKGNLAIFVPHQGCPHLCSFCNQKIITAVQEIPTGQVVTECCNKMLEMQKEKNIDCEIAFFGGSFTAIPKDNMIQLLVAAQPFLAETIFTGIRISTRPDCVDDEILKLLKEYGVTAIELGAQSMDDQVLSKNHRGHTAKDVVDASKRIKKHGFSLGLQMMTGLYGDTPEKSIQTALQLAQLKPDTIRIYPTVVLQGTTLDKLYQSGVYKPQTLEESVTLCANIMQIFAENRIKVIRVGLHAEEEIAENMVAGSYHPAFRELCEGEIYKNNTLEILSKYPSQTVFTLAVKKGCKSKMIGQNKRNKILLQQMGYEIRVVEIEDIDIFEVKILQE